MINVEEELMKQLNEFLKSYHIEKNETDRQKLRNIAKMASELQSAIQEVESSFGELIVEISNSDCPTIQLEKHVDRACELLDGDIGYFPFCPKDDLHSKEFGYKDVRFFELVGSDEKGD